MEIPRLLINGGSNFFVVAFNHGTFMETKSSHFFDYHIGIHIMGTWEDFPCHELLWFGPFSRIGEFSSGIPTGSKNAPFAKGTKLPVAHVDFLG